MMGLIGRREDPEVLLKSLFSLKKKVYLCLTGFYVWKQMVWCDSHNRMICMCWFIATVVITGAWLLRLHAKKFAFVYNCARWRALHIMNVEEDQAAQLSAETRDCRDCLVWNWSLQNRGNSEISWSNRATGTEASIRATSDICDRHD